MENRFSIVFKNRKVFLPVIHVLNEYQAKFNLELAFSFDIDGVFIINHSMSCEELIKIHQSLKQNYPDKWIGMNLLGWDPLMLFKRIEKDVEGIWTDNANIDEYNVNNDYPYKVNLVRSIRKTKALYFGGFAFKYQRHVTELEKGAKIAMNYMDVITTSGTGTGIAADIDKIKRIRYAIGDYPLAIASGITPENVSEYLPYTDCFLVATGISKDFHNFDLEKLKRLYENIKNY